MQTHQAIFIVGSPGSGKDVVIRDISSNHNIVEFTSIQIDEMLSNNDIFKRAKIEKKNSLLERTSILVTANSFDLNFISTKKVLESIGYTSHLIMVEANLEVSYDRLCNRNNLKESLERITLGNSNRNSILELFSSKMIVENSKSLNLSESRKFLSDILDELNFKSDLSLEDILKTKPLKSKLSGKVPGPSAVVIPIISSYEYGLEDKLIEALNPKLKKKSSIVPGSSADATGEQISGWTSHAESFYSVKEYYDAQLSPIATSPMQQVNPSSSGADLRSDQEKSRTKTLFNKIKSKHFRKVVPNGII